MKLFLLFFIIFISSLVFAVESIKADHVQISWLAPKVFSDMSNETIGIHYQIEPHWHVYWRNPGDSGAAPKFDFIEQGNEQSFEVGPIQWPFPMRLSAAHLVNLGYEKATAMLFTVSPKAKAQNVKLNIKLEWLVCKEECIPGIGELTLDRPTNQSGANWSSGDLKNRDLFLSRIPATEGSPWAISEIIPSDTEMRLKIRKLAASTGDDPANSRLEVFPVDGDFVNPQKPKVEKHNNGFDFIFTLAAGRQLPASLTFVVVNEKDQSWYLTASVGAVSGSSLGLSGDTSTLKLMGLLFFAFLGGIILNLMPCVLPVLSIKFLSLMQSSQSERRRESLLYLAGVVSTFFLLGGIFLLFRAGGSAIGWGFQLQSPVVVFLLVLLFWLMSLNFLGFFEFGDSIMNQAGRWQSSGSFTTGVLAVFVAAPCTGPFMGTALGAAAVLPALQALLIFVSLGIGLGFPFVLVAFIPAFHRLMPRPGVWMERLKQFLAFPLLATVVWLMWVLGLQAGSDGWLLGCSVLLIISFGLWLGKLKSKYFGWFGLALALVSIGLVVDHLYNQAQVLNQPQQSKALDSVNWRPYDRDELDKARADGNAVFVDFTAAWCITCQVNKKTVLETKAIETIFKVNSVVLFRGDWTSQDPLITKALAEFDRNSVPVYLFYGPNGLAPVVLPQILTKTIIENLFNKKEH